VIYLTLLRSTGGLSFGEVRQATTRPSTMPTTAPASGSAIPVK
jgi:hypothetical protein